MAPSVGNSLLCKKRFDINIQDAGNGVLLVSFCLLAALGWIRFVCGNTKDNHLANKRALAVLTLKTYHSTNITANGPSPGELYMTKCPLEREIQHSPVAEVLA